MVAHRADEESMTVTYTATGRELAKALVADLNSGRAQRIARARKAAPAIAQPTEARATCRRAHPAGHDPRR